MSEPFIKTLTRTTLVAGVLGVVFLVLLPRHGSLGSAFVDTFTLAFCFTFLGYYVDKLLLALPGIREGVGPLVRVAGWFGGGLWCYVIARWLWMQYGRDLRELPGLVWGGVFLVALELVARRHDATS
jgi:ABC-type Co2+ transport system permease subunit